MTLCPFQEGACLGRSVTSWTSDSGLSPACSRARRWRPCAPSLGFRERRATKSSQPVQDCGVGAFTDRSRGSYRQANRLPAQIEAVVVRLKREYPGWGAPKIREKLRRQCMGPHLPAISTVHAVLDRYGLVHRRRRRRYVATGTGLSGPTEPNVLWCADYKGEFMLADRRVLLSVDNHRFREPLSARLRGAGDDAGKIRVHGLRADVQGIRPAEASARTTAYPFASGHALYGLSKLSVWWLRLGIRLERINRATRSRTAATNACI